MNELKKLNVEKSESKSKKLLKAIWIKMKDLVDLFTIPKHDDEIGTDSRSTTEKHIEKTGDMYDHDIKEKEAHEKMIEDWKKEEKEKEKNKKNAVK